MKPVPLPTLIDNERMNNLLHYVEMTAFLEGAIVEVGVYKGGSLQQMAIKETKKKIYGFDTFLGLPEKTEGVDAHSVGDFNDTSFLKVFHELLPFKNISLHLGMFPSCLDFEIPKVSLMHVDVDMYQSTLECLSWGHDRLDVGGILICDDYGAPTCPGALRAVHEFLFSHLLEYKVVSVVNCQIVLRRI